MATRVAVRGGAGRQRASEAQKHVCQTVRRWVLGGSREDGLRRQTLSGLLHSECRPNSEVTSPVRHGLCST